ncbi:trypco2 family protein [Actinoallomurus soli]|uniref:trypco2 family protein n=1 Tax=Actinoallomurus soli TaxID=2952535 RepID=UPI0020930B36|nr:trypco2 family protein [Actinoallomurus soli]MCO5968211.1 hypothetical protein [Actinoallomurus soli]
MIELSTVIRELREELTTAIDAARDESLRLELGAIELEISVAVTQEDDLGGKVKFWVLELGTDLKDTTASTQRVKLTLQPRLGDATPWVGGRTEPRER